MNRTVSLCSFCLCLVAAGCGNDDTITNPPQYDTVTVAFQDGVSPAYYYNGTRDAVMKDGPTISLRNGNFGVTPSDTIGVVQSGDHLCERRLILKMDVSQLTDCSQVIEATLSIHVGLLGPDSLTLRMFRVLRAPGNSWVEGSGGIGGGVSWTTVDGGEPWLSEGGDYDPIPLDEKTIASDSIFTFTLPPSLVMNWITEPLANHGVIIGSMNVSSLLFTPVYLREDSFATLHPRLEIRYLKGG